MNPTTPSKTYRRPFLHRTFIGMAVASSVIMAPFAINNFVQQRPALGLLASAVVIVVCLTAMRVYQTRRYRIFGTLAVCVPVILAFLSYALHYQGIIGILWCYPAIIGFYLMLPERFAWLSNLALVLTIFPQLSALHDGALALRAVATLALISVFTAVFVREINQQEQQLKVMAETDPLTGLFNRSTLSQHLLDTVADCLNSHRAATLLALDLDHFKSINDSHGHDLGDQVLRAVGDLLRQNLPPQASAFRTGGEEFLLVMPGTGKSQAVPIAERIRSDLASLPLLPDRPVTASIGLAELHPEESQSSWLKRADGRLYKAKLAGRNRVAA